MLAGGRPLGGPRHPLAGRSACDAVVEHDERVCVRCSTSFSISVKAGASSRQKGGRSTHTTTVHACAQTHGPTALCRHLLCVFHVVGGQTARYASWLRGDPRFGAPPISTCDPSWGAPNFNIRSRSSRTRRSREIRVDALLRLSYAIDIHTIDSSLLGCATVCCVT